MHDRESVITHLQIIHTWAEFARECDLQFFTAKHLEDIAQWANDAIDLLKEQKAVKPVKKEMVEVTARYEFDCPCGAPLLIGQPYCADCGKAVKWE